MEEETWIHGRTGRQLVRTWARKNPRQRPDATRHGTLGLPSSRNAAGRVQQLPADPHNAACCVACMELCARVPRMQEARPCGFVYTMLGPGDRPGTNAN